MSQVELIKIVLSVIVIHSYIQQCTSITNNCACNECFVLCTCTIYMYYVCIYYVSVCFVFGTNITICLNIFAKQCNVPLSSETFKIIYNNDLLNK